MSPRDPDATFRTLPTGVRLHYVLDDASGDADRPAIVFVNGLTMDTKSWTPLVGAIDEASDAGRTTLRYDCRGQGASDAPDEPYTPATHADDLIALLDALSLEAVDLVGLSNGGLVAQLVAGRLGRERIRSLAILDSLGSVDAMMRLLLVGWRRALAAGGPELRFDVATPWVWGAPFLDAHLDDILAFRERAAGADPAAVRNLIDGLLAYGDACADDPEASSLYALARYDGPVRVLVGELDVLTPPRYSREIVAAAHPASGVRLEVLEGLGHAAPIEDPARIAARLARFWAAAEVPS